MILISLNMITILLNAGSPVECMEFYNQNDLKKNKNRLWTEKSLNNNLKGPMYCWERVCDFEVILC